MLNHLEGGGQATLVRKPVQVYSSLLAPATTNTVMNEQDRTAAGLAGSGRRWYLLVIVLLYIGLITSFCLNVTLLVRREPERVVRLEEMARTGPDDTGSLPEETTIRDREFAYTTACLVEDPCLAGSYYSCPARRCLACPPSSHQPQWGQTSCWPCPVNTTTDREGTSSPAGCKATNCVHRSRPGLAVLESPNYPGHFPVSTSCHWRVAPGQEESLLILLPYLALPPSCSHTLTIRTDDAQVFSTCNPSTEPILLTAEASTLWVDLTSTDASNETAGGFQLSLLSVPHDLLPLVRAATRPKQEGKQVAQVRDRWNLGRQASEQQLYSHLLSLLVPGSAKSRPQQQA